MSRALQHFFHTNAQMAVRLFHKSGMPTHPRTTEGIAAGAVVAAALARWWVVAHRPSAAEVERRRRKSLVTTGRITDGVIADARTLTGEYADGPATEVLVYTYRLAGVTYNCAQDVSLLAEHVAGYRIDQPVQVRYDPRHPGNSIIVSESWSGLRVTR